MEVPSAQSDMANGYSGGAPGVFVSGMVWLLAGFAEAAFDRQAAFATLFLGGMLIVPVALLISRLAFGGGQVSKRNPLNRLGFEGTIVLFAGILICYALLRIAPDIAFAALVVIIGARYFGFRTLYNEPVYWALGALLVMIGSLSIFNRLPVATALLTLVGAAECAFAVILLIRWKRRTRGNRKGEEAPPTATE